MERVAVDTTFLIDRQKEMERKNYDRGAIGCLRQNLNTTFFLPVVALGESLEEFENPTSPLAIEIAAEMSPMNATAEVAGIYSSLARELRVADRLIGTNDLWIGCTARANSMPILTRNAEHFSRIPGLAVVDYSAR